MARCGELPLVLQAARRVLLSFPGSAVGAALLTLDGRLDSRIEIQVLLRRRVRLHLPVRLRKYPLAAFLQALANVGRGRRVPPPGSLVVVRGPAPVWYLAMPPLVENLFRN